MRTGFDRQTAWPWAGAGSATMVIVISRMVPADRIVIPPGDALPQVVGNFGEMLTAANGRGRLPLLCEIPRLG